MKLQVLKAGQEGIDGYNQVVVDQPNSLEVSHVVDNSCEEILGADVMEMFHVSNAPQLCQGLVSKLRLGGTIVVGGTDVRLFAKSVTNGLITSLEASDITTKIYSMSSPDVIKDVFNRLGLKIVNVHLDGLHYEVKAARA